jgi:dTDP-L-rhamnose 4-epimerase
MKVDLSALDGESVLITGGAGFIGTALTRAILPHVESLTIMDILHTDVHRDDPAYAPLDGVRFIRGDVTDASVWDSLLQTHRPSVIVHLAAETGTGISLRQTRSRECRGDDGYD